MPWDLENLTASEVDGFAAYLGDLPPVGATFVAYASEPESR